MAFLAEDAALVGWFSTCIPASRDGEATTVPANEPMLVSAPCIDATASPPAADTDVPKPGWGCRSLGLVTEQRPNLSFQT